MRLRDGTTVDLMQEKNDVDENQNLCAEIKNYTGEGLLFSQMNEGQKAFQDLITENETLRSENDWVRKQLDCAESFHKIAVQERNYERNINEALRVALRSANDTFASNSICRGVDPDPLKCPQAPCVDCLTYVRADNARLREELREAVEMLDWIGCSPEGYNELMREVEQKRRKFLAALAAPKEEA